MSKLKVDSTFHNDFPKYICKALLKNMSGVNGITSTVYDKISTYAKYTLQDLNGLWQLDNRRIKKGILSNDNIPYDLLKQLIIENNVYDTTLLHYIVNPHGRYHSYRITINKEFIYWLIDYLNTVFETKDTNINYNDLINIIICSEFPITKVMGFPLVQLSMTHYVVTENQIETVKNVPNKNITLCIKYLLSSVDKNGYTFINNCLTYSLDNPESKISKIILNNITYIYKYIIPNIIYSTRVIYECSSLRALIVNLYNLYSNQYIYLKIYYIDV